MRCFALCSRIALSLCLSFCPALAAAQVSITSPAASSDVVVPSASDYATEVLGNPWDMDSESDLADYFAQDMGAPITNRSFSNGKFSYQIISGDSAYFHMLSAGSCSSNPLGKNGQRLPIDSTKYRYLAIRMYSETADSMHALWYTSCGGPSAKYRRTAAIAIKPGWHTYVIDFQTIGYIENGNGETRSWSQAKSITGLRIDPGGVNASPSSPLNRQIDWITLTAAPPATSETIEYSASPQGLNTRYSLAIDDDTNPYNGVVRWLVQDGEADGNLETITVDNSYLPPAAYPIVGYVSGDWATLNFGDPWDFGTSTDAVHLDGLTGSISNGSLVGQLTSPANFIRMNLHDETIPGSTYNYVCINATLSAGGNGCVYSEHGNTCFATSAGTYTYEIDMSSKWNGHEVDTFILGLGTSAGINYQLHWVSLSRGGCINTDNAPSVVVSDGNLVVNKPPSLQILQPDAKGGLDFASSVLGNPWNMNDTGDIKGYANVTSLSIHPNSYLFGRQGDFLCATSLNGSDDPYHPFLDEMVGSSLSIPSRFKNVSVTFYVDRAQDIDLGSTLRIIPCNYERDGIGQCLNGDDTFYHGLRWETLTQDMTTLSLESVIHPNPPSPVWAGNFNQFRIDIHEFSTPTTYCIDRVEVREDDKADDTFLITYALDDDDSLPSAVSVSFYRSNTKGATSGGTAIAGAQNLPLTRDSRTVKFDTSALANGTYYIYGIATDGVNQIAVPATGALLVDHGSAQDSSAPALQLAQPTAGRTVYTSSGMVVSGIAIDEVQLALVEVLIDGTLKAAFVPSLFDKSARSQFPAYADSSNAGFFETVSLAGIGTGQRTVRVRACDTGGNCTQIDRTVTVAGGSDPNPVSPPAQESEGAINLLTTPPALRASVNNKKGILTLRATDMQECGDTVKFFASLKKADIMAGNGKSIFETSANGRTELSLTTNNTAPAKKKKKKKKKAKPALPRIKATGKKALIYFGVGCGTTAPTAVKQATFGNIQNAKTLAPGKYITMLQKKLKEKQ